MGQSKPSKQRTITIDNPHVRINKDLRGRLRSEFDRIQEGQTLSRQSFHSEILGHNVPHVISNHLYNMFSSRTTQDDEIELSDKAFEMAENRALYVMTFDDFCSFYVCFRDRTNREMSQVIFQMLRLSPSHVSQRQRQKIVGEMSYMQGQLGQPITDPNEEFFQKQDLKWLGSLVLVEPDQYVRKFYVQSKFNTAFPIFYQDLLSVFPKAGNNALFNWVPELVTGLQQVNMNLEKSDKAVGLVARISSTNVTVDSKNQNQVQRAPDSRAQDKAQQEQENNNEDDADSDDAKLTSLEVENIKEFFLNEIKNRPAKSVMKVFNKMFKDVKNETLKKYFMLSVSQIHGMTFVFVADLVLNICKPTLKEQKIEFLFEIFSRQQSTMNKQGMKDFLQCYGLPPQYFGKLQVLKKSQFQKLLSTTRLNHSILEQAKPMMIAMTAITPLNDNEERQAILAAMNHNKKLESFVYENLPYETEFYVLERKFWDQWNESMGFANESAFGIKKEHKEWIDNGGLIEEMHQFRMKDLSYKTDWIVVPKYVFYPLGKWYQCDKTITRQVIQYKKERRGGNLETQSMMSSHSHRFMMSNQKFYNPVEEQFEEELIHRKGDFVYELEINPILIYLGLVEENGDKPNKQAVKNGRIDLNYIRKVAKTDNLPFEELQVSRKTNLYQVLLIASQHSKKNVKRGRLLLDEQVVQGAKLYATLEEYGVPTGQLIYAEFANSSGEFPTDLTVQTRVEQPKLSLSLVGDQGQTVPTGQTAGLQNLGNTCYMNSAIQVLANLKFIHEYFIQMRAYRNQLNMKNPLGFHGDLALSFGQLLERMWFQPNTTVIPRNFKSVVSKCCEQFYGFEQQDSQEYLSFLIDGLHEELNLRQKKPYMTNPEDKGRDINELGLEIWSISLMRNWSFMYFLFYGMHRSKVQCLTCRTPSNTFDTFSSLPLDLPEPSQKTISIIVYRVPNRVKDILSNKIVRDEQGKVSLAGFQRMETHSESDFGGTVQSQAGGVRRRLSSSHSNTQDRRYTAQFAASYNYMNNDQPMHIRLKVENEIKIKDLMVKIAQIREVNIELKSGNSELVLFQMNQQGSLRGFFNPELKLSNYQLMGQDLMAGEILTRSGRNKIKKFYIDNPEFTDNHPEAVLKSLTYASEKGDVIEGMQQPNTNTAATNANLMQTQTNKTYLSQTNSAMQRPLTGEGSSYGSSDYSSTQLGGGLGRGPRQRLDRYQHFNNAMANRVKAGEYEKVFDLPTDLLVVAYNRRFVKKDQYIFSQFNVQIIAQPIILCLPQMPSGRRIYDEVWAIAHVLIKPASRLHKPMSRWWERKDWKQVIKSKEGLYSPFVLKQVAKDGYSCSKCHWAEKCNGCIIEPNDAPIYEEDFFSKSFIVVEWNSKQLTESYNHTSNEVVEHHSTKDKPAELYEVANQTTLEDCLAKFHKTESLDNQQIECGKCKGIQPHSKRMEIFIPPPVLVIQLKRFRLFGTQWRKLQTSVDFPIRNLDIQAYFSDLKFATKELGIKTQYDLHGVVNHFGTLGFGHYVSFVKNAFDSKWYKYDDTSREQVGEDKIHKDSAYLLFYVRRDLADESITKIVPQLQRDYFPGKPIKTKRGKVGFVLKKVNEMGVKDQKNRNEKIPVKLKDDTTPITLLQSDLVPDEDTEEIRYNTQQLKEIDKERLQKQKEEAEMFKEAQTTKCCGLIKSGNSAGAVSNFDQTTAGVKRAGNLSINMSPSPNKAHQKHGLLAVSPGNAGRFGGGGDQSSENSQFNRKLLKDSQVERSVSMQDRGLVSARFNSSSIPIDNINRQVSDGSAVQGFASRPRFKLNEKQDESMSHFSQSEYDQALDSQILNNDIALQSQQHQPMRGGPIQTGTMTVINKARFQQNASINESRVQQRSSQNQRENKQQKRIESRMGQTAQSEDEYI